MGSLLRCSLSGADLRLGKGLAAQVGSELAATEPGALESVWIIQTSHCSSLLATLFTQAVWVDLPWKKKKIFWYPRQFSQDIGEWPENQILKIKIIRSNRQSNLQASCQSFFSLSRHYPSGRRRRHGQLRIGYFFGSRPARRQEESPRLGQHRRGP